MSHQDNVSFLKLLAYALLATATATADRSCEVHSTSPTCTRLYQLGLSWDQTVNPCEDFYGYACNNWPLQHSSSEYNTTFGQLDYEMNLKLIAVMESLGQQPLVTIDQNIFNKSYIYYRSCVNEKVRKISQYLEVVKPGRGTEWPLLQDLRGGGTWPAGRFNLFALLGELQAYGLNNVLIQQTIYRTHKGLAITLVAPSLGAKLQQSVVMSLLRRLGLGSEASVLNYARHIKNTEDYWFALYGRYKSSYMSSSTVRLSYVSLEEQFPQVSIFLENIVPQSVPGNEINLIDMIFRDYFKFLNNKEWSVQEMKDLCNYLMIKFLIHVLDKVQNADADDGLTKLHCIEDLRNHMDFPVNLLYYQYIYKPSELHCNRDIYSLFSKARDYLAAAVAENHLTFNSKYVLRLQRELAAITLNTGNFPRNMHPTRIEKFFRHIPDLDVHNYYRNHLYLLEHRVLKLLLKFEEQTHFIVTDNRAGCSSTPFLDPQQGMLILPLGALQPPMYHYSFAPIFKWSMLGYHLAQDFCAAIAYSSLHDWPAVPFLNCLRDQGSFGVFPNEGVPELVGARVAYAAYAGEHSEQLQPQFTHISWKRLFFLNLSQLFCVTLKDEELRQQNAKRLHHIVMNLETFGEAFQCPVGSKMNPRKKCRFF